MASRIDDLVEMHAAHLAHKRGERVGELRAYLRALFEHAQQDYLAAGSPNGEGDEAFLAWLNERPLLARIV